MQKRDGCRGVVDGKEVVIFSSNDYLGLSSHPDVLAASLEAAESYGLGSGGAPGTTGTSAIHLQLAQAIASFKKRQEAIVFPSGYQANQALHQSLGSAESILFVDNRHHPSAVDGLYLSKRSTRSGWGGSVKFDHRDMKGLSRSLESFQPGLKVVSLPSVFTVEGDIAPLPELAELKAKYGFVLVLDEAHATGCLGQTGRGLEEHFNLAGLADFIVGTFSKALGSQGGFLTFDKEKTRYLASELRAFKYSTSLSPVLAAAALKSLQLLQADRSLVSSLKRAKELIIERCAQTGVPLVAKESMIMLIPCREPQRLQRKLLSEGFLVVPVKALIDGQHKDCLRITAMARHTEEEINGLALALKKHKQW